MTCGDVGQFFLVLAIVVAGWFLVTFGRIVIWRDKRKGKRK